jgi:hypothetical protein
LSLITTPYSVIGLVALLMSDIPADPPQSLLFTHSVFRALILSTQRRPSRERSSLYGAENARKELLKTGYSKEASMGEVVTGIPPRGRPPRRIDLKQTTNNGIRIPSKRSRKPFVIIQSISRYNNIVVSTGYQQQKRIRFA